VTPDERETLRAVLAEAGFLSDELAPWSSETPRHFAEQDYFADFVAFEQWIDGFLRGDHECAGDACGSERCKLADAWEEADMFAQIEVYSLAWEFVRLVVETNGPDAGLDEIEGK